MISIDNADAEIWEAFEGSIIRNIKAKQQIT